MQPRATTDSTIAGGNALNLDVTDRRRLAIAAAFTIVALPAIWLFTRGEASRGTGAPTVAAAGLDPASPGSGPSAGEDLDTMGSNSAIFIDGPTTPPKPAVIQIVVPAAVEGDFTEGGASYKSDNSGVSDTCSAPGAPFGATLTVTNRDNGRSVTCVNRKPMGLTAGLAIQLNRAQFSEIAQILDAPVPVRISWNDSE